MQKTPRITLFTSTGCAHCRRARDFLRKHRIGFREAAVDTNRRAATEFQRLGARTVPVILIGEQRVDGFDPKRLRAALTRAGFTLT